MKINNNKNKKNLKDNKNPDKIIKISDELNCRKYNF